jgi:colanic acid biosynthesis glycosyl transferase WcaI
MRILIHSLNFSPEPTGVGKYTGEMAQWLAEQGHDIGIVTAPPHYPQYRIFDGYSSWRFAREKHASESGLPGVIEVFRCPLWIPREPRGWKRILHLMSFSLCSWPVMLRRLGWKPDVVLLLEPTICCSPGALTLARVCGAIAWLHVQDFEVDAAFSLTDFSSPRLRRWGLAIERLVVSKFDRVSAISERMVERLATKGVDPARSVLFPNWVDTSIIYPMSVPSPLRQELQISSRSTVALYSGSMGKKQGLELLIEASRRLAYRTDIQFVFCGNGSFREALVRMTENSKNVIVLPLQPTERLNHLLNLADVHLLPQLADAADLVMPSKLTGMMASGRAVLATAAPGTQLFHAVRGCGMVTPPGDVDAFTAALIQLTDDSGLRNRMGAEGRKYAITRLNRDEVLRRFEVALLEACNFSPLKTQNTRTVGADIDNREVKVVQEVAMTPEKAGDD